jgi:alpha-ketoglutarate-dependent taurine dioxygenase
MQDNLPFVYGDESGKNNEWIAANVRSIAEHVARFGAVLIHGFSSWQQEDIRTTVRAIGGSDPLSYVYRSTPRTELGPGVYTATEYPAGLSIPLHNENSYQRDWPMLLLFFCQQPADKGGGQTTLADTRAITERIAPAIREKFAEKRVMYIRNYRKDIDLPWTAVFQTTSRKVVEEYCIEHDLTYEWTAQDNLRTRQVCDALQIHPDTGAQIWFNQAHLFHPSSLDDRTRQMMGQMFSDEDLPRNARYGDGAALDESDLRAIRTAFEAQTIGVDWRKGDLLILDNMRISHGRAPYRGTRKVFTAMARPFSQSKD